MVINLSIAVHALPMHTLTSLSVDEISIPRYIYGSTNFRDLPLNEIRTQGYFCHCFWKQHLYGHLPPISQTILLRWTKHAWYYWRCKGKLKRHVLLLIAKHAHTIVGWPNSKNVHTSALSRHRVPSRGPSKTND